MKSILEFLVNKPIIEFLVNKPILNNFHYGKYIDVNKNNYNEIIKENDYLALEWKHNGVTKHAFFIVKNVEPLHTSNYLQINTKIIVRSKSDIKLEDNIILGLTEGDKLRYCNKEEYARLNKLKEML